MLKLTPTKQILFLDDERSIQDVTWIDYSKWEAAYVLTMQSAARLRGYINRYGEFFDWSTTLVSLDHDLQEYDEKTGEEITGYSFAKWLVDWFVEKQIPLQDLNIVVHSKNPIGKENIEKYISNAKLFYMGFD